MSIKYVVCNRNNKMYLSTMRDSKIECMKAFLFQNFFDAFKDENNIKPKYSTQEYFDGVVCVTKDKIITIDIQTVEIQTIISKSIVEAVI